MKNDKNHKRTRINMTIGLYLLICAILSFKQHESVRNTNVSSSSATSYVPVSKGSQLDQQQQQQQQQPTALSSLSPEENPETIVRHECKILYSKSLDDAERCVQRINELLDGQLSLLSLLNNITLVDLDKLLTLVPGDIDIGPLILSHVALSRTQHSIIDLPSLDLDKMKANVDDHRHSIDSKVEKVNPMSLISQQLIDLERVGGQQKTLVSSLLANHNRSKTSLSPDELSELILTNSLLKKPQIVMIGSKFVQNPLMTDSVMNLLEKDQIEESDKMNGLHLHGLTSIQNSKLDLDNLDENQLDVLHEILSLSLQQVEMHKKSSSKKPADLSDVLNKVQELKPRNGVTM